MGKNVEKKEILQQELTVMQMTQGQTLECEPKKTQDLSKET